MVRRQPEGTFFTMSKASEFRSLQDVIDKVPSLVDYFYNDTLAPHYRARTSLTAAFIPPEFTNWRDEQHAWRETAVLFDQSHHMPEMFLKGPDGLKLLTRIGINSFENFTPGKAKQFVACSPSGYVIGDCIVYCLAENDFELVSGMAALDWVQFQAEIGNYNVSIERDDPTPFNPTGRRKLYRYQLDGPDAGKILNEVVDGGMPEIPFFRTARLKIRGCEVLALRHGMAGHRGAELSGPYEEASIVRAAMLDVGEKYGLRLGGTKSYFSTIFESGWLPYPLPAIYTGDELRGFREWLPATSWEAQQQLSGSFRSENIDDYYFTPWGLGYERILKFDHDFIGREELEKLAARPRQSKVTLVWKSDDVIKVFESQFGRGTRYKALDWPSAYYGWPQFDEVRSANGSLAGLSCHCGYSSNEGEMLSLSVLNDADAKPGTEVTLLWGEPKGGSRKPHVERHEQLRIRATVAPAPYIESVRRLKTATIDKSGA
jgi:vanillate/3-O-methylgallate O-demethylase